MGDKDDDPWGRTLAAKPEDQSSIPGICMVEGKSGIITLYSDFYVCTTPHSDNGELEDVRQ